MSTVPKNPAAGEQSGPLDDFKRQLEQETGRSRGGRTNRIWALLFLAVIGLCLGCWAITNFWPSWFEIPESGSKVVNPYFPSPE